MNQLLKPAPKTGAIAGDLLNQQIHQAAYQQQWQADINKQPDNNHQGQSWFFQPMAHDGFGVFAESNFVQHGHRILRP